MARKLQIVLKDADYREIQRKARAVGLSSRQWIRQALGLARRPPSPADIDKKLSVIRAAARLSYPVPPEN
jgi:hypothetical protein